MTASSTLTVQTNPLLVPWETPHGLAPFEKIRPEHYAPAFAAALKAHRDELDGIADNPEPPTFANTLLAFDRCGRQYVRIESLFYNLTASETSPRLQAVERDMAAPLAAHGNAIYMHAGLFKRIDALYPRRSELNLTPEQTRLLERVHLDFVRAGAKLGPQEQKRYAAIMERLAELTTSFSQNVLAAEAAYRLILKNEDDLAGLPGFVRASAKQAALDRDVHDGWVITLSRSLIVPFLTFSSRRDLREQAFKAWTSRGEGKHDNRPVIAEIMRLRLEQAQLHGYPSYADYALADTMAGTQQAVNDLLMKVWTRAREQAGRERAALLELAKKQSHIDAIEPWDWLYYAEKVRQARYDLDESAVKPYFPLDRMVEAVFDCARRLFGIEFARRSDMVAYHPDVQVYEVRDTGAENKVIGLFLHDNFARASKRGGAWMSSYRLQCRAAAQDESDVTPIIVNNNNFAKGAPGEPALLSFDDARTLFHEFGHGLHGMLSDVHYERLSGTSVLRDFIELPSQLFEHWISEPEVLKRHARHYRTGAAIPDDLIARIKAARTFNQGFETVSYTSSALVDMALHGKTAMDDLDLDVFEKSELRRIGMPREIVMRHRLPHFQHLYSGSSYAAGYYVYLWAEVLDADGFEAFAEAGSPFDATVAKRLRKFIYSSGNSIAPMEAYRAFRGRAPTVEPMLKKRGLIETFAETVE
jgi:peptidyl-dipeptidase Dcp